MTAERLHARTWCAVALLLLAWNGFICSRAGLLTFNDDGVQYQLLARNRLQGHFEVGDTTQTVGSEGRHPMWRPGLVWIEEELARITGSVARGSAATSGLGTTCSELALLWLGWCCFGKKTWLFLLLGLAAPAVSFTFLILTECQGPEVWAAACLSAGIAAFVNGLQRRSWLWAVAGGTLAGAAQWFRTGNLLAFAVPCAVYGLAALRQGDHRRLVLAVAAFITFVGMGALCDRMVPSSVNKTVANLRHWTLESNGPLIKGKLSNGTESTYSMAGLRLVPGTAETYYDWGVRSSNQASTLSYIQEYGWFILARYLGRLKDAVGCCFSGLRGTISDLVVILFALQLLLCLAQWEPAPLHTFACAGGALAHYFAPVMLIKGNQATHYLFVVFPLFLVVAGRGAERLVELGHAVCKRCHSVIARPKPFSWPPAAVGLVLFLAFSVPFYRSAVEGLSRIQQEDLKELAALRPLELEGRKVACRNMCWFVDQKVQTVLLPYATIPELENYIRVHAIDGLLIWEKEPRPLFSAMPYRSAAEFEQALQQSSFFDAPHTSGSWRWYPVRRASLALSSESALPGQQGK